MVLSLAGVLRNFRQFAKRYIIYMIVGWSITAALLFFFLMSGIELALAIIIVDIFDVLLAREVANDLYLLRNFTGYEVVRRCTNLLIYFLACTIVDILIALTFGWESYLALGIAMGLASMLIPPLFIVIAVVRE